jgi:hypothetical protein
LLPLDSEDGPPKYLFQSESNVVEFTVIEEEMQELNEFCHRCDEAAIEKIDEANNLTVVDPTTGERDEGWTDFMRQSEGLRWTEVQEVLVAGMILGLLFAFTEKSLKWLCERLSPDDFDLKKKRIQGAKVEGYISILQDECGLSFSVPEELEEAKRVARPLRNKFTHGDWETFGDGVGDVDLSRVFSAVSALFAQIEDAAYPSNQQ